MNFKIVYLTGAPASGKTTLSRKIAEHVPNLKVFEYGNELTNLVVKSNKRLTHESLRTESSKLITKELVAELDETFIAFVNEHRSRSHVLIDSHAVTKETYGFRVIPFTVEMLKAIGFTSIAVLYCSSTETARRIKDNSQGRPLPSLETLSMHTQLQASVALSYSATLGIPAFFFDSEIATVTLLKDFSEKLFGPSNLQRSDEGPAE